MNAVFSRARDKTEHTTNNQESQRPLYFRAEIAEPEDRQCDDDRGSRRSDREPGQFALVRKTMSIFRPALHLRSFAAEQQQFINRTAAGAGKTRSDPSQALRLLCARCHRVEPVPF